MAYKLSVKSASGAVKEYNLKDNINTSPKLSVQTPGGTKYLGLKSGTKSGEIQFNVNGQTYYAFDAIGAGNVEFDEAHFRDAVSQSRPHNRGSGDDPDGMVIIPFLNAQKQLVACLLFAASDGDRQGPGVCFVDYARFGIEGSPTEPLCNIKINRFRSAWVNRVSRSDWVYYLNQPVVIQSKWPSACQTKIRNANRSDNTITTSSSARVNTAFSYDTGYVDFSDPNCPLYTVYVPGDYRLLSGTGNYLKICDGGDFTAFIPGSRRYAVERIPYSGTPYNSEGVNWDGFGGGTWYAGIDHGDSYNWYYRYGHTNSGLHTGYNSSNGLMWPSLALVANKKYNCRFDNGVEDENAIYCCYSFIEFPGTQLLGCAPLDLVNAWYDACGEDKTYYIKANNGASWIS